MIAIPGDTKATTISGIIADEMAIAINIPVMRLYIAEEGFQHRSIALRTNMIKAVIFDMDGVLIDTEKYYIQLGMDITKEMGYEIPREVFLSMRSLNRKFSSRCC